MTSRFACRPNRHWRTGSIFRDFSAFGVEQNPTPGRHEDDQHVVVDQGVHHGGLHYGMASYTRTRTHLGTLARRRFDPARTQPLSSQMPPHYPSHPAHNIRMTFLEGREVDGCETSPAVDGEPRRREVNTIRLETISDFLGGLVRV